jgi:hypothetical protein
MCDGSRIGWLVYIGERQEKNPVATNNSYPQEFPVGRGLGIAGSRITAAFVTARFVYHG